MISRIQIEWRELCINTRGEIDKLVIGRKYLIRKEESFCKLFKKINVSVTLFFVFLLVMVMI